MRLKTQVVSLAMTKLNLTKGRLTTQNITIERDITLFI